MKKSVYAVGAGLGVFALVGLGVGVASAEPQVRPGEAVSVLESVQRPGDAAPTALLDAGVGRGGLVESSTRLAGSYDSYDFWIGSDRGENVCLIAYDSSTGIGGSNCGNPRTLEAQSITLSLLAGDQREFEAFLIADGFEHPSLPAGWEVLSSNLLVVGGEVASPDVRLTSSDGATTIELKRFGPAG